MDQSVELAVLEEFLDSNQSRWIPLALDPEDVESGVTFVRACGAMYRAVRSEYPHMQMTTAAIDLLCRAKGEFPQPSGDGFWDAEEWGRSGWFPISAPLQSAIDLARTGEIDSVLIAATLNSHGYNYYGGQGRALAEGYVELIPAIISSLGAARLCEGSLPDVPPWYDRDGRHHHIAVNALALALSPRLTAHQREALLQSHEIAPLPIGDEIQLIDGLGLMTDDFIIVATELGIDLSSLFEAEDVARVLAEWRDALEDPEDPDVADQLEVSYLAYLVTRYAQDLDSTYARQTSTQELKHDYPWVSDWRPWQLTSKGVWPPTLDALREANDANDLV